MATKGDFRPLQDDTQVGRCWTLDIMYLPASSSGHRYLLTLAKRVTSYVSGIAIKSLNSTAVATAFRQFLCIMPAMAVVLTDHGVSDFGSIFTQLCESLSIEHGGSTPRRSEAQGGAETANRILHNTLARICATGVGRRNWDKALPRTIQSINCYYPYRSKLSRTQFLFTPFFFSSDQLQLANPIAYQNF